MLNKNRDFIGARLMAELLTMASDEFFDNRFDLSTCRIVDCVNEFLTERLGKTVPYFEARMRIHIHSIPDDVEVFACHSDFDDVSFLFDGTKYDLECDVQDAYHGHYAKDQDELEEVDNDGSASFFHATLMLARDGEDVCQCPHCSCFVDGTNSWEDGERMDCLSCPYCDLITRKDEFVSTDSYGKQKFD